MKVIDYGDATVETKQWAPGTRPDSVFGFGLISGSPDEDLDIARLMLAAAADGIRTSERAADV
jgi:hypothetical protein